MAATFTDPAEYGRCLAQREPPITDEQAESAARILAAAEAEAAA